MKFESILLLILYIEDFFGFLNILKEQKVFDSEDALLNRHKQVDNDLEHVDKDLQEEYLQLLNYSFKLDKIIEDSEEFNKMSETNKAILNIQKRAIEDYKSCLEIRLDID